MTEKDELYQEILEILSSLGLKRSELSNIAKRAYSKNDIVELDDLLYDLIYNKDYILDCQLADAYNDAAGQIDKLPENKRNIYKSELGNFWGEKNISAIERLFDGLYYDEDQLGWYKRHIIEALKCDPSEIEESLKAIRSWKEADIVLEAIECSNFLGELEKGYNAARKRRQEKRCKSYSRRVYEIELRRNRHRLEKTLQRNDVGINRSKKISKILLSI